MLLSIAVLILIIGSSGSTDDGTCGLFRLNETRNVVLYALLIDSSCKCNDDFGWIV